MTFYIFISLAAFVIAAALGGYVLARNPQERLNQIFFFFSMSGAYWAFTEFGYRQADSIALASFWIQAGSFWTLTPAFELHFILLFTERRRWLRSKLTYYLIYAPVLLFSVLMFVLVTDLQPAQVPWGWAFKRQLDPTLSLIVALWMTAVGTISLVLALVALVQARNTQRKRQVTTVAIGLVSTYVLGFVSMALPTMTNLAIPDLTSLGFIIECLCFAFAIWRFSLFGITPASAAEKIISTMQDALLLVNTEGSIVTANQAAASLLHTSSPEDLLGRDALQFLAAREQENYENKWRPHLLENGFINDTEAFFKTMDGREVPVSLSASISRWEEGQTQGVVYVIRDLTERKEAEKERLQFEHQMHQAQKFESLGILAKGIAHDFNNLLMIILGNSDIAIHSLPDDSKATRSISLIKKTALRSSDLVRQMLTYSGKGKFVLEPIALNTIIKDMADLFYSSVSKKATMDYDLAKPLPVIQGDLTQIRQVILNLVTNASEALGDRSGAITIRTSVRTLTEKDVQLLAVGNEIPAGRYVQLEVADEGAGIPPSEIHKIFDPFYSTKFPGRGLGLSSVMGIVRELQGYVDVQSQVGIGTRIAVGFPTTQTEERIQTEKVPEPEEWQGAGTVLIVDDEEEVLDVASQFVEMLGFTPIQANNGKEALEKYRESGNAIKFILLDLTMPEMDGEETSRHLREMDPQVQIVIASGYDEGEIRERFRDFPLLGVIQKPFQFADLQARLRQYDLSLSS